MYCPCAGSFADVIYTDPPDTSYGWIPGVGALPFDLTFDFDGNGQTDIHFHGDTDCPAGCNARALLELTSTSTVGADRQFNSNQWAAAGLPDGVAVGPLTSWIPVSSAAVTWARIISGGPLQSAFATPWNMAAQGTALSLPVKFSDGLGATHYGWIRIRRDNPDQSMYYTMTLLDYAYESNANTPIVTGVVPSPGPVVLLACGGVLAGFQRRSRKAAWRTNALTTSQTTDPSAR
jgi:hypothetical protein